MNKTKIALAKAVFTGLTMLSLGCRPSNASQVNSIESLEREFVQRVGAGDTKGKTSFDVKLNTITKLLRECDEAVRKKALEHTLRFPFTRDLNGVSENSFEDWLQAGLITIFCKNDTNSLQRLVAARCPFIGKPSGLPIEFQIVVEAGQDAIFLFPKAYRSSTNSVSASNIVECLERAFPALKQELAADAFVTACEKWYASNRTRLIINKEYPLGTWGNGSPETLPLHLRGLFVDKQDFLQLREEDFAAQGGESDSILTWVEARGFLKKGNDQQNALKSSTERVSMDGYGPIHEAKKHDGNDISYVEISWKEPGYVWGIAVSEKPFDFPMNGKEVRRWKSTVYFWCQ